MEKIELKYNPYTVETSLFQEKQPFRKGGLVDRIQNKRLQEWIETFPEDLSEELGTKKYELIFYGTSLDYDDVEYAFKKAEEYRHIKLTHNKPNENEQNKLEQIKQLFSDVQQGPFEQLNSPKLTKAFNDVLSDTFEVSVVATMSSGKSTLINALMRQELMPSKNQACTAIITKIIDDNRKLETFDAIQFDQEGKQIKGIQNITLSELTDWNDNKETSEVEIVGNIPFTDSKTTKLVLVDTPGPNNANNKDHSKTTYESLGKSAKTLIIYVLNATQLGTNDDYRLLKRISESMRSGGKKSRDRFIFVVNKLDDFNPDNEPIKGVLDNVKDYLESIGIEDPNIYAASARDALRIRGTNLTTNSLEEAMKLGNMDEMSKWMDLTKINGNKDHYFEEYAPLIPSLQRNIQERLSKAKKTKDQKEEAMIHSGLPSIEAGINLYLNKYAVPQKIKTLVDTFNIEVEELALYTTLEESLIQNQEARDNLSKQIDIIKNKTKNTDEAEEFIDNIQNNDEFAEVIEEKSREIMNGARKEIDEITKFEKDDKYSVEEAENRYGDLVLKIQEIKEYLEVEASELLTDTANKIVKEMLDYYEEITRELFDNQDSSDKLSINPFELSGLNKVAEDIDEIQHITQEEEVITIEIVSAAKWYNPFSWGKTKEENKYSTEEVVYAKDFHELFTPALAGLFHFEEQILNTAQENQNNLNEYFKKEFEKYDEQIKKQLDELESRTNQIEDKESRIHELSSQKDWLSNISDRLEKILAI